MPLYRKPRPRSIRTSGDQLTMELDQLTKFLNTEPCRHSVLREPLETPLRAEVCQVLTVCFESGRRNYLQNRSQLHQWLKELSCNLRRSKDLRRDE